ncbi:hypothetical protein F3J14_04270 [Burkholderia sp. Tr-862]|uniref:hypothetical protein n=1 Tax=Burkholderia sp. Tr-862 TaxID=2608331 RepID=UPI001419A36E|nr:hypothetical protein [Burkholderia sp. Tr-862]NIF40128.1 hypothetical protein [Burkholderia sp. Tr-862]
MLKRLWCRLFGHAKPITYKARDDSFFYVGPDSQGMASSIQWECPRCGGRANAISLKTTRPHRVPAANRIESDKTKP